ncbi:MAG: cobaltochelatase subunit CobN [Aquificaceae bacterium]
MKWLFLFLILFEISFGQVAFIVGFPNSPKKLKLLLELAEELKVEVKGIYLRNAKELQEIGLPEAELYLVDLPIIDMRDLAKKRLEGKRVLYLSEPPEGEEALYAYYSSGGKENFRNMLKLLFGLPAEPPKTLPLVAFYHPRFGIWENLPREVASKSPVVVFFHRSDIVSENTHLLDTLIEELEGEGIPAFGFFYPELEGLRRHKDKLFYEDKAVPSLIINLRLMYFTYEEERKAFEELGVPIMGAFLYRGKVEAWRGSKEGLPVASIPLYYTLPEYLGIIDISLIGYDDGEKRPVEYMMGNFVKRVKAWRDLFLKGREERKVAILYYNYPPGEKNILASNLNVIRSLYLLLEEAKERGYRVKSFEEKELQSLLTHMIGLYYKRPVRKELVDCLSLKDYEAWFGKLPQWLREEVEGYWGPPQRDSLLRDGCFPMPILKAENFALLPLAPRGIDYLKSKEIYHSTKIPPSHYYLAFYLYLQRNFDAIVSFGTHGTMEWTPGKERALDLWDYPYLLIGEKPHIYPYIVDNIGESLQAKRRGRALIISHQTPVFSPAGTYGELEELHQLLHKETQAEGKLRESIRREIAQRAIRSKIDKDLGYKSLKDILRDFEGFAQRLHEHIHSMAMENIPLGLHTFGKTKEKDLISLTILQMLGRDYVRRFEDTPYEEFLSRPLEEIKGSKAFKHILSCIESTGLEDGCGEIKNIYASFKAYGEIESFFNALDGKYIPTSYGGDPIKNPSSLPTGRNLYAFDPQRIPTPQAWRTAVEVIDQWLKDHKAKYGKYPKKVAFSLWSVETMRHFGITEAQILYLLGVRPKWDEGGRVVGLEIISKEELKRPRIDVLASATGLYRDHFPNLMHLINQAVRSVEALEEEDNRVRENTERIKALLLKKGYKEEEAKRLATIRTFSNESGAYGSGLDEAVFKTKDKKRLSDLFLFRMGFAYDKELHSVKIENLFEENLKEAQAVVLSRSSNTYGMLTTDDPFQYLGGLALSVEVLSGKKPEVLITDLRRDQRILSAEEFLIREVRARYFNPEYIKALMKEGYSGVNELLNTLNNLYGWQVVSPQVVKEHIWKEFKEVYLEDRYKLGTGRWLMENPWALKQIEERLKKGMAITGYGIPTVGQKPLPKGQTSQAIKGRVLQKVKTEDRAKPQTSNYILLLLLLPYLFGLMLGSRGRA